MDNCAILRNNAWVVPKITVLLDPAGFDRLSAYCDRQGFKKSTLIARLIREHLDSEDFHVQAELPLTGTTGRERRATPGER